MYYVTIKLPPSYHQMTLDEFLFGGDVSSTLVNANETNTRTYEISSVSQKFRDNWKRSSAVNKLRKFNEATKSLHEVDRHSLYREFYIPKKSGGLRKIDAPNDELKNALRSLKTIFEEDFWALYHTSAFAYVRRRSTIDCLKRHQANESRWFAKYDLSNFFGSTTKEFVMSQLAMIFPFSELINHDYYCDHGKEELEKALDLAFLDGGLPQGTPLSPLLTNIIMIPIDFKLANTLRNFENQRYIYTRYAEDFQVSSRYSFSFKKVEELIVSTLEEFDAPFKLNANKTRYGSSAGRNWNLGIMLNNENQLTVGHKKKKQLKLMLENYCMDKKNHKDWDISDVRVMEGYRNYYRMVEEEAIDGLVKYVSDKHGVDVMQLIRDDLRG